jgi:hypothetical protein
MAGIFDLLTQADANQQTFMDILAGRRIPRRSNDPVLTASNVPPAVLAQANQQDAVANMDASSAVDPSPMIVQAMQNGGRPVQGPASYDDPDTAQALAQAQIDPTRIAPGPDPFANTYNRTATGYQSALKAAEDANKSNYGWADALIDAGRGLMIAGSPDPARAAGAFSDAWANERASRRPKVTPLQNGAFSLITNPDGSTRIVRNDEVADFIRQTAGDKLLADLVKIDRRGTVAQNNDTAKLTNKELVEQAGGVDAPTEFRGSVNDKINRINNLVGAVRGIDTVAGVETPFIANIIDQTYGRLTGSNSFSFRRDLESLINEDVLTLAQQMKGALSNADVLFLKSIQPRPDDPIDRKITYLNELRSRIQSGEERRIEYAKSLRERGVTGQSGGQQGGEQPAASPAPAPAAAAPAASSGGPTRVSSEDDWAKLPSGTRYIGPDGKERTKR